MTRPTQIDARLDPAAAALYRLVRLDTCDDIAGTVWWADEATGSYAVRGKDNALSEHCLGAGGLRIVPRSR